MTPEELLKPRYKVIADYPGNVQTVGHIYKIIGNEESIQYWCSEKDKYPHIFKKMEWWEERNKKDLPEYLKSKDEKIGRVDKWKSNNDTTPYYAVVGRFAWDCRYFTPATKEEYEQYLSQQTTLM
jgi:hypothetical protein